MNASLRRLSSLVACLGGVLALQLACGSDDRDVRMEARVDLQEVEADSIVQEDLRALGYVGDEAGQAEPPAPQSPGSRVDAKMASKAARQRAAHAPRKAPDTGSLSELDYRNAQNLSQRANEALDYLGPGGDVDKGFFDARPGEGKAADLLERIRRDAPARRWDLSEGVVSEVTPDARELAAGRFAQVAKDEESATREQGGKRSPSSPAKRFLRERRAVDDLAFQPSSGYWANTYVPGDPVLRWLESRLAERDRSELQAFAPTPLRLESAARQTTQPFDPPGTAAVSVFVQADRRGLEREERMLVQVGLQGANRRGGLRPAMSIGVVVDGRGALAPESSAAMRALLEALLASQDLGDRFSLTVAGRPGGLLVRPEQFRHGPLTLAMTRIFEGDSGTRERALDLTEAVARTAQSLERSDDPTAPLGSSMVLLVTSQSFGPHADALARAAHVSAVAGVPVSVVAVGDGVSIDELERVALAGQGNLRNLAGPAEAEGVVDRELSALARVVARALRLHIRLAPGVKLVEVVGAERLDAARAQQVRQAERSIDRRLARNLGIEADRGEDDDGIQIVIPAFYAGDSHAVLLDVVASGPGSVADVTVRYKDLVYLRNSVARANLSLGRSVEPPGPLERNVVKNYLAERLAETLKQAGRSLLEGGDPEAIAAVRDFKVLLDSLRDEVPSFRNDVELASDSTMLGEYLALLQTPVVDQEAPRRHLADSLQLSGYFKTVPRTRTLVAVARR